MRGTHSLIGALCVSLALSVTSGRLVSARDAPAPPSEARIAKAAKVFELTLPRARLAGMLARLRPAIEQAMMAAFELQNRTPPEDARARMTAVIDNEFTRLMVHLRPRVVPVYAQALTEPELDALLRLYESPEGRSVLEKLPGVSAEIRRLMAEDLAAFQDRILRRIDSEIVETTQ